MPRESKDPAELIPLKQSTYRVLLALSDGEWLHGYAIMQLLSEMTRGREAILPGTLYAALARMVDEGLIETRDGSADDPSGGPKRRYYRRTSFGRAVARAESERLRALLDIAEARKILPGKTK
jgi:DNA-binding PadR family transcriptional regulator